MIEDKAAAPPEKKVVDRLLVEIYSDGTMSIIEASFRMLCCFRVRPESIAQALISVKEGRDIPMRDVMFPPAEAGKRKRKAK